LVVGGEFAEGDARGVNAALAAMDLESFANRQISALSGGQQQRAFLARSLAQQAHIILLDEPFTGLDQNSSRQLAEILRGLARDGRLVLASHHDLKSVPELFDPAILLNGELIAQGLPEQVLDPDNIQRAYGTKVFAGPHHAATHA